MKDIAITTSVINRHFKEGEIVTPQLLVERGVIRRFRQGQAVKVINRGDLKSGVKFSDVKLSSSLKQ